jgi:hypothetical protein
MYAREPLVLIGSGTTAAPAVPQLTAVGLLA